MATNGRVILSALLWASTLVFGPSRAAAQDGMDDQRACHETSCGGWIFFGAIAGTAALAVDSILIAEAIDKATHGYGLYQPGASFELFWGVAHLASGVALAAHATDRDPVGYLAGGIPVALLGAYFIVHGALSLTSARPPEPSEDPPEDGSAPEGGEREAEESAPAPSAALSVAPSPGGAMVQVFGRF